jgi:nucleoside phosphorylase
VNKLRNKISRVDILILCAVESEFREYKNLSDVGIKAATIRPEVIAGYEALTFKLPVLFDLKKGEFLNVVVARCGQHYTEAYPRSSLLIKAFSPKMVAMSGICAGYKEKVRKGDLIFANSCWTLGDFRDVDKEKNYDIQVKEVLKIWVEDAESFSKEFIKKRKDLIKRKLPSKTRLKAVYGDDRHDYFPEVKIGDFVHSEGVRVSNDLFPFYRKFKRHTIALEEEAFAVASAAGSQNIPFIVVKGVQDFAQKELTSGGKEVDKNDLYREISSYISRLFILDFCRKFAYKIFRRINSIYLDLPRQQDSNDKTIPQELLINEIRAKLELDFKHSSLSNRKKLISSTQEELKNLIVSGLIPSSKDKRFLVDDIASVLNLPLIGHLPEDVVRKLKELKQIRVCCSSIYPAAISVLESIKHNYCPDMIIEVDTYNSIDLVEYELNKGERYDFVIAADDPFVITGGSETFKYQRLFPVQRSPQWLFQKKYKRQPKRKKVLLVPGSSGYTQLRLGIKGVDNMDFDYIRADEIYQRALDLERGEIMPVWAPIAHRLEQEKDIELIKNSIYNIYVSIFCLKSNWVGNNIKEKYKQAFLCAFVYEWNKCSVNIDYCIDLLTNDEKFMKLFDIGSGFSDF